MKRRIHPIIALLLAALLAGCATMSKKECENADWHSLGYSDGSRGIHYSHLEKRRKACAEYRIAPDDTAYQDGWTQGIRRYCNYDTGYRAGSRGARHITYCPQDIAPDYLNGWRQGVRQYCQPEHALQQGLAGHGYNGICPADMADAFEDFYRLGRDVRQARASHHELEERLDRTERALLAARDPKQRRDLLHSLARLRHDENRSDARVIALEACMNDDWYDAGYRDGEDGQPARYRDIADTCRGYGLRGDRRGYREGWRDGVRDYCSYDSGLYAGQNNLEYLGVCSGYGHSEFWRGYERGRDMYRHERYEEQLKPVRKPAPRRAPQARPGSDRKPQLRHTPSVKPNVNQLVKPAARARPAAQPQKPAEKHAPQPTRQPSAKPEVEHPANGANGKANGRDMRSNGNGHGQAQTAGNNGPQKQKQQKQKKQDEEKQRMEQQKMDARPMNGRDTEQGH